MTEPALPSFYRFVALDRIDSTNEEAKRRAAAGAPAGTLIWAREQTAGRGRRGRPWHSLPGNLFASVLLRPSCGPAEAAQIGFAAALAVGDLLERLLPAGTPIEFKWPNDVMVGRRKISGILLEASAARGATLEWLVVGIGVNIVESPGNVAQGATCLRAAGAPGATAAVSLGILAERFLAWWERWQGGGFAPLRERWLDRALGLGETIEVRLDHEAISGRFSTIDEHGSLVLDLPSGGQRRISAGDLFFPAI